MENIEIKEPSAGEELLIKELVNKGLIEFDYNGKGQGLRLWLTEDFDKSNFNMETKKQIADTIELANKRNEK